MASRQDTSVEEPEEASPPAAPPLPQLSPSPQKAERISLALPCAVVGIFFLLVMACMPNQSSPQVPRFLYWICTLGSGVPLYMALYSGWRERHKPEQLFGFLLALAAFLVLFAAIVLLCL